MQERFVHVKTKNPLNLKMLAVRQNFSFILFNILFLLTERCPPFALCKVCLFCKEKDTIVLVPLNEPCIVVTSRGKYMNT